MTWHPFDRGSFVGVGFSSSDLGDNAPNAIEYYLVAKEQVVRIEWQTDAAYGNRVAELQRIRQSVDRASVPPKIEKISRGSVTTYRPGDKACLFIVMDDLRNGFEDSALEDIEVEGAPNHFSFKTIRWVPKEGWFEVCLPVTSAFGASGLRIVQLRINTGSNMIDCDRNPVEPYLLECVDIDDAEDRKQAIRPDDVAVENPSPDQDGPVVSDIQFDPTSLTIRLNATDATGFGMAVIGRGGYKVLVYPDQVKGGQPVSLAPLIYQGWNVIDSIVLYDSNGLPTLLRLKPSFAKGKKGSRVSTDDETYEVVTWSGQVSSSSIPVIAYLSNGGFR